MFSKRGLGPNCMVIFAVDSTARPLNEFAANNPIF
jgi:hypothetical protein